MHILHSFPSYLVYKFLKFFCWHMWPWHVAMLLALRVFKCLLLTSLKLCRKFTSLFALSFIKHTSSRMAPAQSLGMLTRGRDGWNCFVLAFRLLLGLMSIGCSGSTALQCHQMSLLKQLIAWWCGFPPEGAGDTGVNPLGYHLNLSPKLWGAAQDPTH